MKLSVLIRFHDSRYKYVFICTARIEVVIFVNEQNKSSLKWFAIYVHKLPSEPAREAGLSK